MVSLKKGILFGFLIWLTAFIASFLIFPFHESNRPLFEAIMPVVISLATVFFSVKYFELVSSDFAWEGLLLGILFMGVNWFIDALVMLSPSPMQMSLGEYIQDIGITYLMMLPITWGMGILLQKK